MGGTSSYHPKIQFIDETKIEANTHKYNFVWQKNQLKETKKDHSSR